MIEKIIIRQKNYQISPIDICNAGRNIAQSNPGTLSNSVRNFQNLFSSILNKNQSREK